ncbi:MAG: helix-turn-helix transcriptional regulator [Flavobacterium sp.]|jgi:transcriptional regulator with XRE-family HTH domain|nr:helix-turn-helix transcriptional regulator [Flavobacterium sp.]|tara:strand:- start:16361 stop:16735 length:375 start_codon:yes stop_codon:yes gene_type:complete
MVNISEFTIRLKKILDHYDLSASLFADKIGVQRSSISHILSERNKPSLDFILKITNTFTDVDIYWLLNGRGSFPKKAIVADASQSQNISLFTEAEEISNSISTKKIDKIVVFYNDGTFNEYNKE